MIQFNELRVTPDGKNLIVDASVKNLSYYDDIYIDSILVDTQDTYVANGPSSKPAFKYQLDDSDKNIRLELNSTLLQLPIDGNLFFVYVVVKGTPSPDTPCGMDNTITMGVTANLYPFYRSSINYMKEIENNCDVPRNFVNAFLQLKALELSIKTGHYAQAIKYWNKFFKEAKSITINTGCNCNGGA